ncbi:putative lipoprotein [Treponema primitia ZAS-2]|uniref:Putative lipoprotein n=1 Tax=Treponema primitia (strain ATCC BAA-887 / DSM 12427 / ZAS-2) TaxID=545694 RepID=F5YR42_TREPZ|nr:hypothetical protein [Treponema primitia]AEF83854.1 putative lipoprotein [Treponema primitia ZAS-2]
MILKQLQWGPTLLGVTLLAGCLTGKAAEVPKAPAYTPPSTSLVKTLDALSGASISRINSASLAYVNGTRLNALSVDNPDQPLNTAELPVNAQFVTSNKGTLAIVTPIGDAAGSRKIHIYNQSLGQPIKTFDFEGTAFTHDGFASVALTDEYLAIGSVEGTTIYIYVYDIQGNKPVGKTNVSADGAPADGTIAIAAKGNYLVAGLGPVGTGVYQINPETLGITKSGTLDGVSTHWIKYNDRYVIESKNTGVVKVWKWGAGAAAPTAGGSISVPNPATGVSGTVRALQFDPENPDTAYFASWTGGGVYKVNLANASQGDAARTLLFSYPAHTGPAVTYLSAWMIEKESNKGDTYFVLTGGHSPNEPDRADPGITLIFKNPPSDGSAAVPFIVQDNQPSRVRTLRTLKDSHGNIYFAAKDSGGTASGKLTLRSINY